MSIPICSAHPESRILLVQYVEGNLSWVCRTCGLDLLDVLEAPPTVQDLSQTE